MTDAASKWITAYRKAWESNDPGDIGSLFTADALYYGEPFTEPAFVQCETDYGSVKYSNLWVIRFAASAASATPEATEFTDWCMHQSKPSGD